MPYLNSLLGGFEYLKDPPALILKSRGRLITLHARKIAINALKDEAEAEKILQWLMAELNAAWAGRDGIQPSFEGLPRPGILEILRQLPKTNCRKCGQPTRLAEYAQVSADCPELSKKSRHRLEDYLGGFTFKN